MSEETNNILKTLLSRYEAYSTYLLGKINSAQEEEEMAPMVKKRKKNSSEQTVVEIPDAQPKLLTGGVLRKCQIRGLKWMKRMYEIGANGILADETGCGKKLQVIAAICTLIEQKVVGPYLIAAPLSSLQKWVAEFKKFAPEIYTVLYHGSKEERREKRENMMRVKKYSHGFCSLPVVISSYDALLCDRQELNALGKNQKNLVWKYLVVADHTNLDCEVIKELNQYNTETRLLVTGIHLQKNLAELWSLVNFLLADDILLSFRQSFNFSYLESQKIIYNKQEAEMLRTLYAILNPLTLQRLKTGMNLSVPKQTEEQVQQQLEQEQLRLEQRELEQLEKEQLEREQLEREQLELKQLQREQHMREMLEKQLLRQRQQERQRQEQQQLERRQKEQRQLKEQQIEQRREKQH